MIVCDPGSNCGDNGVNPYDSYVIGDITAQTTATYASTTPFYDPGTGAMATSITVTSPADHLHVEAGYNPAGQTVINSAFTDAIDPASMVSDQIVAMQTVGDYTTERNVYGASLSNDLPASVAGPTPMDLMGTLQDANVTNGALLDISGTNDASQALSMSASTVILNSQSVSNADPTPASASAVKMALLAQNPNAELLVEQPSANLLRIIETEASGSATPRMKTNLSSLPNAPLLGTPATVGTRVRPTRQIRTYAAQRGQWVLQELRTETSDSTAKQRFNSVHVLQFRNLRWQKNFRNDALRRKRRPTAEVEFPTNWTGTSGALAAGVVTPNFHVCDPDSPDWPECGGSGGGGGGAGGTDLGCGQNVAGYVNSTGQNIVFQHGFLSDATTWCSLEPVIRSHFTIGFEVRHSLTWTSPIANEALDLRNRLDSERGSQANFIFVGHSNGGLISRQLAEQAVYNNPSLVRGVLEISTPNHGLPIANVDHQALLGLLTPLAVGGCWRINHTVCRLLAQSGQLLSIVGPLALNSYAPVVIDDRPGSAELNSLNNGYEPYIRAAVQNYSWNRWTEWLLVGQATGQGRGLVKAADKTYHRSIDCAIISGILGFFWAPSWKVTAVCATVAADLYGYDMIYKRLTVPGEAGDGLVPGGSQLYPNAPPESQYAVLDADSHVGVLAGNSSTGAKIRSALVRSFQLVEH